MQLGPWLNFVILMFFSNKLNTCTIFHFIVCVCFFLIACFKRFYCGKTNCSKVNGVYWRLKSDILPKSTPKSLAETLIETLSLPLENSLGTLPDLLFRTTNILNLPRLTFVLFSVNHLVVYLHSYRVNFVWAKFYLTPF